MLTKIITWLLFVLTFSLRMEKCSDKEQVSPQPTVCLVYSMEGFGLFIVLLCIQLSNHPYNNGETGEYFCIYCTFVTKKRLFICNDSIQHVMYHLLCFIKCFVLDVTIENESAVGRNRSLCAY